jgi:type I restriction-modification system DNA methylase subunit
MQTALTYRTNRDLFSNYYLDEHLPETEAWDELSDDDLREAKADIMDLWEREQGTAPKRNESQLEEKFIRPMFRKLGIPFEVEESTDRTQRRPDYGFFESEDAARGAFDRREEGDDFYKHSVAVADAKRWGRPLDTRGSGEHERDFENPSYQIHVYLQETPVRWAVLTDGRKWRLYYDPTSHRLDSYYEIDLPTVLEKGDLEDFKYFYLFFRHGAFLEDSSGECFLDEVYDESNVFAQVLGEDLQDNIYEAIKILSEGFMQYPDNDLSEDDLDLIHDSSLIYLYRLIFVLYAESEGRDLLDTNNEIYEESYSLNTLKQDVAEELDSPNPKYHDWQDNLWDRLDELFKLIDQGSKSRGIPEEDLYIPAYNGGLFRTSPDEDDSVEARFIANHQVGDAYLAEVIELLTRSQNGNGGGKIFVDYSSLDVRHLGSIYEGLLEYQLDVADEPLAVEDGEYVPAGEGDEVIVEEGEVHLSTGSGERKATGSYYTPEYIVEHIVEETLGPLVDDIRSSLVGQSAFDEGGFAAEFAEEIFDLKILDPAMGSGHFLTSAIDYLAREIIDAQERQAAQQGIETVDEDHDINWARRQVAQRCIYGVDLNPLAVELAKVSLWLRTLAAEQPLAFLDHHLKTGNSLVGSDIKEIEELESDAGGAAKNAKLADFGVARKGTIEQLMRIYGDFVAIENQDLADVKEMEAKYDEFERNKLRQRLEAMANVHTAEEFGLDNVPSDAYKRMAKALESDSQWNQIQDISWFQDAQNWANEAKYFHWKLEYPEVFYGEEGNNLDNPGFDAIIGNPPYISVTNLAPEIRDYLTNTDNYRTATGRYDAYIVFLEQSLNLCRSNGILSMIVPIKWAIYGNGRVLRNILLDEVRLNSLTNVSQADIFDGPTTYPCIPIIQNVSPNESHEVDVLNIPSETPELLSDGFASLEKKYGTSIPIGRFKSAPRRVICPYLNDANWQVHAKLVNQSTELGEVYRLEQAIRMGSASAREKLFRTDHSISDDPDYHPVVDGEHIDRYHIDWDGRYLHYVPDELYNAKSKELLHQPKILLKRIAERMTAAYDGGIENDFYYPLNTIYTLTPQDSTITLDDLEVNPKFHTALMNSTLLDWDYKLLFAAIGIRGGYIEFREYLEHLPLYNVEFELDTAERQTQVDRLYNKTEEYIKEVTETDIQQVLDDSITDSGEIAHDLLVSLVDRLASVKSERSALNTNIADYLGEFFEGKSLTELSGYQPASGRSETILADTAADLENLRIGTVSTKKQGNTTTLLASARYKPEEPDDFETDQWGYTETDLYPVIEFIGLDEELEALVQEFVPYAVSEARGYAGFREQATKRNSLIDRLENIHLPDVGDVSEGLSNYVEVKSQADALDREITNINYIIDQIVFKLYDITEEEIETVKSGHRE